MTVMWFRRDLRLADNPALVEAVQAARGGSVMPLFVLDDALWTPAGPNRRAFLSGCLRALDEALDGRLVVRRGPPERVISEFHEPVYAAEDFGPYGRQRDEKLLRAGIDLRLVGAPYAVAPGQVRNAAGGPYKVFTPFSRAWRAHGWSRPRPAPTAVTWRSGVHSDGIPAQPSVDADLPAPGEAAAEQAVRRFWRTHLDDYDRVRSRPDIDGTSRLSPYLKWGCLHPRQLLDDLGETKAHDALRNELCWREFYADVLHHRPESARRSWNRSMGSMRVDTGRTADDRFEAWAHGETGFPIVDAGMRQLRAEGWMHNRVRMITASFLVKDLHIDWTRGARHFMRHLVDGDLGSNQHGWQWVAGTGTDAAPYVRVFNPVTQSKRFDPDGFYIRRYVSQLAHIDAPEIHEPPAVEGYPAPIVDHRAERQEALSRFATRGS